MESKVKQIEPVKSIIVLIISLSVLVYGIAILKANPAVSIILAGMTAVYLGMIFGCSWAEFESNIGKTFKKMFVGMLIMMFVGMLIGSWMSSGTVPMMMYYGLKYLPTSIFLIATCLICTIMSLMTGTSWGTMGTVGVALIGISEGLGIPIPYAAGAIVVGALFGDKLSVLSDSTILASSLCDVNIIEHIKSLLYTTIPAYVISLMLYLFLGFRFSSGDIANDNYQTILSTLEANFYLSPILVIPPIVVLVLIMMKKPAIPVFGIGIIMGGVFAMIFQNRTMTEVLGAFTGGMGVSTGVELVDDMVNRGGLLSMMPSIALIIGATIFASALKTTNVFTVLLNSINKYGTSRKSFMVLSYILHLVLASLIGVYLVTFAIVGPVLSPLFDKFDLHRKNLSRLLEDTGTAFSPIVPWSNISVYILGTLGITSFEYVLYAPMTYLGVVLAMVYIYTGYGLFRKDGSMFSNKRMQDEDSGAKAI